MVHLLNLLTNSILSTPMPLSSTLFVVQAILLHFTSLCRSFTNPTINPMFKRIIKAVFCTVFCSFLFSTQLFAATRYVKPVASGLADGSSWANASADLQTIINASIAGDEVWVAAGRYIPTQDPFGGTTPADPRDKTFSLKSGVKVYGGFVGTESTLSQRPATAAGISSILSGDLTNNDVVTGTAGTLSLSNNGENAYHTVMCVSVDNVSVLDGFTISGGNANGSGSITISGNIVLRFRGGGIYSNTSQNIINNCNIINSYGSYGGGAYFINNSATTISNSSFINNLASLSGGAGSGICGDGNSSGQIYNCIFVGNNANNGTAFNFGGPMVYTNCTFSGNSSTGAGVSFLNNGATAIITNCICWNPGSANTQEILNVNPGTVFNYCVSAGGIAGTANSGADPKFIDASLPAGADGIYRTADDGLALTNCSAAYNRGTNTGVSATDILGIARPQASTTDMGAYESTAALNEVPTPAIAVSSFSCTSTTLLASGGDSYLWSGGATPNTAENTFTAAGTYNVTATGPQGCMTTISQTVTFAPTATITGTTTACFAVTLTAGGGVSYLWSGGNTPNNAVNTFTTSGTYIVTVTGANSCTSTASATVTVNNNARQYVNAAVASSGDGSSWATALKTVQEAIDKNCVHEVWVAAGTYIPTKDHLGSATPTNTRLKTFYLKDGLKLYGGFNGTETLLTQRNIGANATILSGDLLGNDVGTTNNTENVYHVILSVNDANTTILDGFVIKGGNATTGGTISVESRNITTSRGGGIVANTSSLSVSNCVISANRAISGAGVHCTGTSSPSFTNCVFSDNAATSVSSLGGGGIFNELGASLAIKNCIFTGNTAYRGGGFYCGALTELKNATFFGNSATNSGGGIYGGSSAVLTHGIIWGNTAPTAPNFLLGSGSVVFSDVQGFSPSPGGVINADPLFVNSASPAGADGIFFTADDGLALQNTSPALDAGTNNGTPALDILGNGIYNLTKDMGAYENRQGQDVYTGLATCQALTASNVSGSRWYYFRAANGIAAAINPNGEDLGTVTLDISDAAGAIGFNSKTYLGRSINITSSNYAAGVTIPTAYSLRLYYYDTEQTEYNTATNGSHPYQNFDVEWWQGGTGCTLADYAGNVAGTVTNAGVTSGEYGVTANGFYLQFNLNHFTIFAATDNSGVLPLQLLSFTGKQNASTNLLQWTTANEINTKHFKVERSTNGNSFTSVGTVNATGSGNNNYYYDDAVTLNGTVYYRLKMVDKNGKFTYSNIIKFSNKQTNTITVYPNPIEATTTLQLNDVTLIGTVASIQNMNGQTVKTVALKTNFQAISLQEFPAGIYFLRTVNGQSLKLIKN